MDTAAALERVDELAAVPDIDLFIGPADLAASLGHPGNTAHPEVQAACRRIVAAARQHGKLMVTACARADYGFWLETGVDLLFCTNDISCLKTAAADSLEAARRLLAQQPASTEAAQ
jgi:2-keto-3-deoxy-L-rhamnonate aldolase RhmA